MSADLTPAALVAVAIPLLGTTAGAACVLFMREVGASLRRAFLGFAGGVMVAASVWSLLIPAMELSAGEGMARATPALVGFLAGVLGMLAIDSLVPHLHVGDPEPEGRPARLPRQTMLMLAVTIHNVPEGAACGALVAAALAEGEGVTLASALALSVGLALQNFPEGAVISLPLRAEGAGRGRAFLMGALSGAVEPVAALATVACASLVTPALPLLMAFAAGAMVYVVVEELVPEASQGAHSNLPTIAFSLGFALMMVLDVVLG